MPLFSEVGRDMSSWPNAAHFISWPALCPDNDISGGKLLWRGARKVKNRAGHIFRLAAFSLHHSLTHSLTPLGNYLRRMKAKLGPQAATMATAHKIAVIFYTMVKNQVEYDGKKVRSKTQTASQTTGLRTCPHRTQGCITNRFSVRGVPWKLSAVVLRGESHSTSLRAGPSPHSPTGQSRA